MEEQPKDSPAKAFLKDLWSEVLWKAKRNLTKETFDALDAFIESHHAFFEAGILEPFSYEQLFQLHFPKRYELIKTPYGSPDEQGWRELFLSTSKEAYADDLNRRAFAAAKNNELEVIRKMIREKELNISNVKQLRDFVEEEEFLDCLWKRGFQAALDSIFIELLNPTEEEDFLFDAVITHQPLAVIEKTITEKRRLTLLGVAIASHHFDAVELYIRHHRFPASVEMLKEVSKAGSPEQLGKMLALARTSGQISRSNYEELIECATKENFLVLLNHAQKEGVFLSYHDLMDRACESGKSHLVKAICEHISKHIPGWKGSESYREFAERGAKKLKNQYDYRIFVYLLEIGIDPENLSSEVMELLLKKFRPEALKKWLIQQFNLFAESRRTKNLWMCDHKVSRLIERCESEFAEGDITGEWLYEKVIATFEEKKPEQKAGSFSRAESIINTFVEDEKMIPVTAPNIDSVTLENTIKWEWVELVRRAVRYPSADNAKQVKDYLEKYKNILGKKAIEFYAKNKSHFVSPLARLPRDLLGYTFFKASNPSVALVNRRFRDVAESMPASEFAYRYPREHKRILRENPAGKINWKEKLREADERAYENLPDDHAKLFRALRDPSKNVDAIQAVLQKIDFVDDYHPDRFLLRRDEVEGENICQCARRNNLQPILDSIYTRICDTYREVHNQRQSLLRVVVACFQSRSALELYLNKEELNFDVRCVAALKYAIQVENVEAAEFLFQHTKRDVNEALDVFRDERGTPLVYACEFNSVVMAWWLISQGADVGSLTPEERDNLVALTVEGGEKFQQHVSAILEKRIRSMMKQFVVTKEKPPVLEENSEMTEAEKKKAERQHVVKLKEFEKTEKENAPKRLIYAALQALLNVLINPGSYEHQKALEEHKEQLEGKELKLIYESCKLFLKLREFKLEPFPEDVPLPPSPPDSPMTPKK